VICGLGEARYVPTPGGWAWSECLFEVPDGTHIIEDATGTHAVHPDGFVQRFPRCSKPRHSDHVIQQQKIINAPETDAEGWQAWSSLNTPTNVTFDSFVGTFNVPAAPADWPLDDNAVVYLFTGLQNDNWVPTTSPPSGVPPGFAIIQPVLQYGGGSANGGGKFWGLASWYVTVDDNTIWSKTVKVDEGDVIFGNMTRVENPSTWFIGATVLGKPNLTSNIKVSKPRLENMPWAYCTLEMYTISKCSWIPPSPAEINFENMVLTSQNQPIKGSWQLHTGANPCKVTPSSSGSANVTLAF